MIRGPDNLVVTTLQNIAKKSVENKIINEARQFRSVKTQKFPPEYFIQC